MVVSRRFERVFTWLVKFIVASGGLRLLRALSVYCRPQITKLAGAGCGWGPPAAASAPAPAAACAAHRLQSALKWRGHYAATPRYERTLRGNASRTHKCTAWKLAQ